MERGELPRYPVIDAAATGRNLCRLRLEKGYSVKELQEYLGLGCPQGVYQWQAGRSLPSVDNLYALSARHLDSMNEIIISTSHIVSWEQQAAACCSGLFMWKFLQVQWAWQNFKTA